MPPRYWDLDFFSIMAFSVNWSDLYASFKNNSLHKNPISKADHVLLIKVTSYIKNYNRRHHQA